MAHIQLLARIEKMNEGDQITTDELIENWESVFKFYDNLIENGFKLQPIRLLIRYIIDKGYSKKYFGGTSFYTLLISIPTDRQINYTKTLQIKFDELTQTVSFNYKDKSRNLKNLEWSIECQATEIIDTFEHFLNKNWTK